MRGERAKGESLETAMPAWWVVLRGGRGERMRRWLVAVKRRSGLFVVGECSGDVQLPAGLCLVFRRDWGRETFSGIVILGGWYGRRKVLSWRCYEF